MTNMEEMLHKVEIPKMAEVRQKFSAAEIEDVAAEVRKELHRDKITALVKPGMRIAVTAGSRGIANYALVIREIVAFIKELGGIPFVIPAMGSHGGATAQGQREIIEGYGITEEFIGCPIQSSMDVTKIGELEDGTPLYIDSYAAQADGIVLCNRIKAHTAFHNTYESGLVKMSVIGLGKQYGAEICHKQGVNYVGENVKRFAMGIFANAKILFGVALLENAFEHTSGIYALEKEEILQKEPELLDKAKEGMARLFFSECDILIVDRIGKNISGEGMDPNIAGRWIATNVSGGIDATRICILSIDELSHHNGLGLGMADVTTRRAVDAFDPEITYPNSLTNTAPVLCKIPMFFKNDKLAIQATIKMTPDRTTDTLKIIRIKDTLHLENIEVSEALLPYVQEHERLEQCTEAKEFAFNAQGDLF